MQSFDYIVVGGGSSGCAITHRLTKSGARVLLLEDGPADDSLFIHMPATFVRVIGSKRSVIYTSEPQPDAGNRITYVPQGRTLGGGSSLNAMVYIRGQKEDYEEWERQGCTGWGWDNVLKAFKRSESHMRLAGEYHGTDGPLKVSDTRHRHPLSCAFIKAAQQVGIPYNDDFNGASQAGVGFYHTTTFDGRRGSTAATYLAEVKDSPNLTIRTGCYVNKIIFDENKRATGVELRNGAGQTEVVKASKEIVLAAGALSTPKILMLSGVGPKAHLAEHNIPLLHDAPEIGQNYQDHLEVSVYARTKDPISLLGNDQGLKALKHGFQWTFFKTGLLTSNVVECGGFVDTSGCGRPDVQFHVIPTLMGDVDREPMEGHGLSINPCFLRPKSRGFAKLRSNDPKDSMIFESGALSHEDDVQTLVRGVKLARQILRAPAYDGLVTEELAPSAKYDISDDEIVEHVRSHAKTVYHPVGTCRMGSDATAVVDTELRVNGVQGLRVCDASVMPTLVSGNTNAPTIMIAERCAEFMLNK
ncbi:GMC family oxidoreductase [Maribrevibacterium harenarium]|uniref:GMC family oxidoreductase n=1 Tax=Maribrevibacterium harenarium TaxID=2589817 RepID=A0A501X2V3_9GAMM|nr:GMC family oxidoreductase N-terminal domain-containing protein [Maribrevibacterium harenarium]TPE54794.1 GMC family oxidoreductase [Maribrevibacterium harenarium]